MTGLVFGFLLIILVVLLYRMRSEAFRSQLSEEQIEIDNLPVSWHGTKILFISDLHRRTISEDFIEVIRDRHVELVLVGGDMTEKGVPLERVRHNMTLLRKIAPMYAVHGNHDYKGDYRQLDIVLQQAGVHILDNEAVWLEKDGHGVWLVGVDDVRTGRDQMRLAFSEPMFQPACTLLLIHDPVIVKRLKEEPADLILAGHTHGGQIRLPIYGPIIASEFYRQYSAGLYHVNRNVRGAAFRTKLFISRGFGTSHFPLRLNCPAEAHIITLLTTKKQP